jgi:hypothetical protein
MSILNRPNDGLVSVLVAMVRSSALLGTMPKNKLLEICCPKSLASFSESKEFGPKTLNRWIELGLFTISDNEEIRISENYRGKLRKANASASSIAEVAREIVLLPLNNKNFWSNEENRGADFSRAVAWMLAQDVYDFVPTSHSQVEPKSLEQANSSEVILFQNDTRWSGFVSWATFLGFGRPDSGKASGGFITDPTPAVYSVVNTLMPKRTDVPIREFLSKLSESLPVLDGGDYRKEVEGKLRPEKWKSPKDSDISTSLSRALLRLEMQGTLRFEKRSDSDAQMRLIGRAGNVAQIVTHVHRGGTK